MLQKIVFLFCDKTALKLYEFVPYKYGCFSFALSKDQDILIKMGYLDKTEEWSISERKVLNSVVLSQEEATAIDYLVRRFGGLSEVELIRYVYRNYPYYAINSVIAKDILSHSELKGIEKLKNKLAGKVLYSIGYEGFSLEGYMSKLMEYGVRVVCDVRKNPISRKFGFSKKMLSTELEAVGIKYLHYPQLGIPSEYRRSLVSQKDYDDLFDFYEKTILKDNIGYVKELSEIIDENGKVALLCFEKDPKQCHRTRVARKILEYRENDIIVVAK